MLFKVNQKEKVDLSAIKAGLDTNPSTICADCDLCGLKGNDESFEMDQFE